ERPKKTASGNRGRNEDIACGGSTSAGAAARVPCRARFAHAVSHARGVYRRAGYGVRETVVAAMLMPVCLTSALSVAIRARLRSNRLFPAGNNNIHET